MGRVNLVLRSVFSDIFRTETPSYKEFLDIDSELGLNDSQYRGIKRVYRSRVSKLKDDLILIALIEELIIQLRCLQKFEDNLKIFFVNDYLYARTVFYRVDKGPKDIRVPIMRKLDLPTEYVDILTDNKKFMKGVKLKLKAALEKEIEITREKVNKEMRKNRKLYEKTEEK